MTCIIGYVAPDGRVYMGGDSVGASGWDVTIRRDPKVFTVGCLVIGISGSFRYGNALRYGLKVPDRSPQGDIFRWMVADLIPAMRTCLREAGFLEKKDEVERASNGGVCLLGVAGRLFGIEADLQVSEGVQPYRAIGCGGSFALGALAAMERDKQMTPRARILAALAVAERFSGGVRRPFIVRSII